MNLNRVKKAVVGITVLGILAGGVVALAQGHGARDTETPMALSDEARQALITALVGPEGEYAAYAMYTAVIEEYGNVEPYFTIREAEARHIAALQRLLDKYGVDYPRENPYLGQVEAPASLEEAAQAWAKGEIANVEMYDRLLEAVQGYPDVARVFENLRRASLDRHLPAFQAAAENGGVLARDVCGGEAYRGRTHGPAGYAQNGGRVMGRRTR